MRDGLEAAGDPESDGQEASEDPKRRRPPNRLRGAYALFALVLAGAIGLAGAHFLTPRCDAQDACARIGSLESYRPPEPPRIYDADGNLAGQLSGPRRIVVDLDSIPAVVRDGYVAVEDRRFRSHSGVDLTAALRALTANLRSGGIAEGGSTITMQLARNVFGPEVLEWNRFRRKAAEVRIARRLESELSKDEILELYLNQIYLGDGVYGVETASQHYFGKPVGHVSTREAALLIGLAKNPEGYNPRRDPYAAHDRIETVLEILAREHVISPDQVEEARAERVELTDASATPEWGKNAYYLSAVRRAVREIVPDPSQRQGLRVFTGLDPRAQAAAVEALVTQIRAVEAGRWGKFRHAAPTGELPRAALSPYLQGMVVAMDPVSGVVTTLVGGRDYTHSEFDRAFQARRQPGSAFKPFVYAAALQNGVRLSDRISTAPVRLQQQGTPDWEPGDHVNVAELTVRDALVQSSNTATVRIGLEVGIQRVSGLAHQMGISTTIPPYPSAFLGAGDVIPAELVAAYAPFGNGGRTIEPHLITRIEDSDGHVVYRHAEARGQRALDPRIAFLLLDAMRDVVTRGTGWRVGASGLGAPAAGKTGTTNDSRDVWFVGMTQGLLAGVWMGFDEPKTIVRGGSGGDLAAPVWATFMGVANRGRDAVESWEAPPGVVAVEVDGHTGARISPDCPTSKVRVEYFLQGTEPPIECYYPYDWNGWNGTQDSRSPPERDTLRERLYRERLRYLDSLGAALQGRPYPDTVTAPAAPSYPRPFPTPADTVQLPPPESPLVPGPSAPPSANPPPVPSAPPTSPTIPLPTAPDTVWLPAAPSAPTQPPRPGGPG